MGVGSLIVGLLDGAADGASLGCTEAEGSFLGCELGFEDGASLGCTEAEGSLLGCELGVEDGITAVQQSLTLLQVSSGMSVPHLYAAQVQLPG
jgi:hypothetical protein